MIKAGDTRVADTVSLEPISAAPELRKDVRILMKVPGFFDKVKHKRWDMIFRSLFCKIFYFRDSGPDRRIRHTEHLDVFMTNRTAVHERVLSALQNELKKKPHSAARCFSKFSV
jgi:hypothetical protein